MKMSILYIKEEILRLKAMANGNDITLARVTDEDKQFFKENWIFQSQM